MRVRIELRLCRSCAYIIPHKISTVPQYVCVVISSSSFPSIVSAPKTQKDNSNNQKKLFYWKKNQKTSISTSCTLWSECRNSNKAERRKLLLRERHLYCILPLPSLRCQFDLRSWDFPSIRLNVKLSFKAETTFLQTKPSPDSPFIHHQRPCFLFRLWRNMERLTSASFSSHSDHIVYSSALMPGS